MWVPLFPLHVVLFPGVAVPLHVFEERYRAMMRVVLDGDRRFGVVAIRSGAEVGGVADTFEVGCLATVDEVTPYPDGRMDLVARGIARFRIERRLDDDPYPQAEVSTLDETLGEDVGAAEEAARAAFARYLASLATVTGADVPPEVRLPSDPLTASYAIAAVLQVDVPVRQRLLETPDAATRLRAAASLARDEAALMDAVGPPAGRPANPFSGN